MPNGFFGQQWRQTSKNGKTLEFQAKVSQRAKILSPNLVLDMVKGCLRKEKLNQRNADPYEPLLTRLINNASYLSVPNDIKQLQENVAQYLGTRSMCNADQFLLRKTDVNQYKHEYRLTQDVKEGQEIFVIIIPRNGS